LNVDFCVEVTTDDGKELWSKLKQPDGRNNFPHVFPKAEFLVQAYRKIVGDNISSDIVDIPEIPQKQSIYTSAGTRVGVW
jgi:hypothetical protein